MGPSKLHVFQQVGTPAQTSKRTQEWLGVKQGAILVKVIWAPESPYLNPPDCIIWATVEDDACKKLHTSVLALKKSVARYWTKMTEDYIEETCHIFRGRLDVVVAA